jgi:hypothetical protein
VNAKLQKLLSNPTRFFLESRHLRPILRRVGLIRDTQHADCTAKTRETAPLALQRAKGRNQTVNRDAGPDARRQGEQQRKREAERAQREQRRKRQAEKAEREQRRQRQAEKAEREQRKRDAEKAARELRDKSAVARPRESRLQIIERLAAKTSPNSTVNFDCSQKSIVILSDSADALSVAEKIASTAKRVQLLWTTNALAERHEAFRPQESQNIAISSVHKHYSTPLSETESQSVDLARTCAADLFDVLKKIIGRHISDRVISTLSLGLEHALFNDAVTFHTAKSCLKEFDLVLFVIDNMKSNNKVIRSFLYHAGIEHASERIFYSSRSGIGRLEERLLQAAKPKAAGPVDESQLIADFTALWDGLQDPTFDDHSTRGSYVAVCGNVANDNYGHAPASLKLVEVLARRGRYPVLFHSSTLMTTDEQDAARKAMLAANLSTRCSVYGGWKRRYEMKYPAAVLGKSSIFSQGIFELFLDSSRKRLPHGLIDIFQPTLFNYIQNLFVQIIFISESTLSMARCKLVATAVDRSLLSRILCAIAKDMGIPSIGIQSQLMSVSPRYIRPAVDRMGVIDSSQIDIYRDLGASPDSLEVISSVNYIDRLRTLDTYAREATIPADRRTILFAMQHSNADQMIAISTVLRDIAERHDVRLIVKPHPQQESPLLHEVLRIFGQSKNASVLSKESDTYAAITQCGMVVGLNSNVLLESALIGKPVLVAAFNDLHPSIDYSILGVALKSLDPASLEQHIVDVIADGPLCRRLAETRDEYLRKNPQFLPPYTYERLESFIASALPAEVSIGDPVSV